MATCSFTRSGSTAAAAASRSASRVKTTRPPGPVWGTVPSGLAAPRQVYPAGCDYTSTLRHAHRLVRRRRVRLVGKRHAARAIPELAIHTRGRPRQIRLPAGQALAVAPLRNLLPFHARVARATADQHDENPGAHRLGSSAFTRAASSASGSGARSIISRTASLRPSWRTSAQWSTL